MAAAFHEGRIAPAGDDEVIQRPHVNHCQGGFKFFREPVVRLARLFNAGRVIVSKYHGPGIQGQRPFHHFAGIDCRLV